MKEVKFFIMVLILMFAFVGCKPDLVVKKFDETNVTWEWEKTNEEPAKKEAIALIANIGNKGAGEFMVYFNAEEDPVSPNRRPQVSHHVSSLAKGNSITLKADFAPLAHPDNDSLRNVYKILVIADPKNMVEESNKNNNEKEVYFP
ncbi:hypothetical protein ES703_04254 [subsurface metagenome]